MPKLQRAKPVAWGLLRWGKWVMMVERQGSKVSWQNMAFLLGVADGEISRSMPQGGESNQLAQKPTPERQGGSAFSASNHTGTCTWCSDHPASASPHH